jgi:hypothetical protein
MGSRTPHTLLLTLTAILFACGSSSPDDPTHTQGQGDGGGGSSGDSAVVSAIPLGVYTCLEDESGGFLNVDGGSGTITLTQTGTRLTATYAEGSAAPTVSFTFAATSASSATLDPPGQPFSGSWVACGGGQTSGGGIADPAPGTATLSVTGGQLTYDATTLFMSIVGHSLTDIESGCQAASGSTTITATFTCKKS